MLSGIKNMFNGMKKGMRGFGKGMSNGLKSGLRSMQKGIKGGFNGFSKGMKNLGNIGSKFQGRQPLSSAMRFRGIVRRETSLE